MSLHSRAATRRKEATAKPGMPEEGNLGHREPKNKPAPSGRGRGASLSGTRCLPPPPAPWHHLKACLHQHLPIPSYWNPAGDSEHIQTLSLSQTAGNVAPLHNPPQHLWRRQRLPQEESRWSGGGHGRQPRQHPFPCPLPGTASHKVCCQVCFMKVETESS